MRSATAVGKALAPIAPKDAKQHWKEPMRCLEKETSCHALGREWAGAGTGPAWDRTNQNMSDRLTTPASRFMSAFNVSLPTLIVSAIPLQSSSRTIYNSALINGVKE
jgi:hypothetical protein